MQFFYARSTGGLYLDSVHGDSMPADCVPISKDLHAELIHGEALGRKIVSGQNGVPYLTELPPTALHKWADGAWQLDLSSLHNQKRDEINLACESAIKGGFWSAALGAPHQYSSQLDDQLNLTGMILHGFDSLYACRNEQGVKAFRPHIFAQLRQVGDDFTVFKLQLLQKANELKQRLDQALADGDLTAIESITWEDEQ